MIRYAILGPIELSDGERPLRVGGPRQVALLAFLLVHANRAVSSDRLIDVLWDERNATSALQSLHVAISRLRKTLHVSGSDEHPLRTVAGGYLLAVQRGELDAELFQARTEEGRDALRHGDAVRARELVGEALAMWRGPALAEIAYEAFAQSEIRRLEELRLTALEEWVEAGLQLGEHSGLIAELEALVAAHPGRERLASQLMLALYRCGRQGNALEVYARTRVYLAGELGLEPGPALQTLQAQILEQSPALDEPAPRVRGDAPSHEQARVLSVRPFDAAARRLTLAFPRSMEPPTDAPFVGRDAELVRLRTRWADGRARSAIVIGGEAGIGKTRLASELARAAHVEGELVLFGRCDDGLAVPYQPFVEALRPYVRAVGVERLRSELGDLASELRRLLPEVAALGEPIHGDPESERFALFEAIAALIEAATRDQRALIVLDDLHWATTPTLLLLRHLIRSERALGALMVCTFRQTELDPGKPLAQLLADLHRDGSVLDLRIGGLDESAIAALVETAVGHALDERGMQLVQSLEAQTAGNPFFIHELLAHLTESGTITSADERADPGVTAAQLEIPEGLRHVIGQRVARLSTLAGRTLTVAAVAGQTFSCVLLEHVLRERSGVLDALDEARRAGLLTEASRGRYMFSHALVRQTIYEGLGLVRLTRLHRRLGEALEELGVAQTDVEALAHHFAEAAAEGQAAKAASYGLAAGRSATARLGYEEAAAHYERALQALTLSGEADDHRRCELLLGLAEARCSAGQTNTAGESCAQAADLAERLGDPSLRAKSRLIVGRLCMARGRLADARAAMDAARRIAHEAGDALAEFGALVNLGYVANTADSLETGIALLQTADRLYRDELAQAENVDAAELLRGLRRLQGFIGVAEFDSWRFGAAARRLESCIPEMRKLAMGEDLARTLCFLGQLHMATGGFEDARATLSGGIAVFSDRREDVALRALNRAVLGKLFMEWDRRAEAQCALGKALREVQGAEHTEYQLLVRIYLSELLIGNGDHDEAAAQLDTILAAAGGGHYPNLITNASSLAAEIALAHGDHDAALQMSGRAVGALEVRRAMVLVRTEEIFLRHARILRSAGEEEQGRDYVRRALEVVREKEHSIDEPEIRERFLSRIPINRAILRIAEEQRIEPTVRS